MYLFRGIPTWVALRGIGNSKIVRLSAAFPLVGYLILFNDEVSKFLSMSVLHSDPETGLVESIWRGKLYFVYFGLMAIGVASAIYQWLCPFIIKKHGDWADYVRIDGDSLSDKAAEMLGKVIGRDYRYDCTLDSAENVTTDYMREFYRLQSTYRPGARSIVSLLFGIGFFLLAIPSSISAIKIMNLIFRRIF